MTNPNFPQYRCPKCGSEDELFVLVSVFARLYQYEGIYETEPEGDHEWDDGSAATCSRCAWAGEMGEALIEENPND